MGRTIRDKMIKAVFFDIDDTIYDYTSADKAAVTALKAYCRRKLGLTDHSFEQYISSARHMADERTGKGCAAVHNRLIRFQCMLEIMGKPPLPHAYEMYRLYWDTLIGNAKAEPGIRELMGSLKRRGTYVGIGTNMTADIQYRKLEHLKLGSFIDGIVTSEEAGAEKPDEKLFLLCAQKALASPCECVFVGDSLKNDIQGAERAGMHAVLYQRENKKNGSTVNCPVIRDFSDYFKAEQSVLERSV